MQTDYTKAIRSAVDRRDADALAEILFRSRTDTQLLTQVTDELTADARYASWLAAEMNVRLMDIWFIVFKYTQPSELVAAFEFDYFVRHSGHTKKLYSVVMESVIDEALQIKYFGPYGISEYSRKRIYGQELFLRMRPNDRAESLLAFDADDRLPLDDALLNPPRERLSEWTVFHVKMRRIAFMILRALITTLSFDTEPSDAAFQSLKAYATRLKTLMWHDERGGIVSLEGMTQDLSSSSDTTALHRRMHAFFMPAEDFVLSSLLDWHSVINSNLALVNSQIVAPNEAIFIETFYREAADRQCLVPSDGTYNFIYRPSAEARQAFFHRVVTVQ